MNSVVQLGPMSCGRTIFVADELRDPRLPETDGVLLSLNTFADGFGLLGCRNDALGLQIIKAVNAARVCPSTHEVPHLFLKRGAARDHDPYRDRRLCMKAFEVLQVAIKEGV